MYNTKLNNNKLNGNVYLIHPYSAHPRVAIVLHGGFSVLPCKYPNFGGLAAKAKWLSVVLIESCRTLIIFARPSHRLVPRDTPIPAIPYPRKRPTDEQKRCKVCFP